MDGFNLLWVTWGSLLHFRTATYEFWLISIIFRPPHIFLHIYFFHIYLQLIFLPLFWTNLHLTSVCLYFTLCVFEYVFSLPMPWWILNQLSRWLSTLFSSYTYITSLVYSLANSLCPLTFIHILQETCMFL